MLQIVTGMYFRSGVRLNSTMHRAVLYTNRVFLRSDEIELPVGKLLPSTGFPRVSAVTVSVAEHLEAELPDGKDDILIATSGTELIDDLADVLSFALNWRAAIPGQMKAELAPQYWIWRPEGLDKHRGPLPRRVQRVQAPDQQVLPRDLRVAERRAFLLSSCAPSSAPGGWQRCAAAWASPRPR